MHKAMAAFTVAASSHVAGTNRSAVERTKAMLARNSLRAALASDDVDERAKFLSDCRLASFANRSTSLRACGKV